MGKILNSISNFDYNLPGELIADTPAESRDTSKLLVYKSINNVLSNHKFLDLENILDPGDVLILNDTKVIPARMNLVKETTGAIEILFHKKISRHTVEVIYKSSRSPIIGSFLLLSQKKIFKVTKIVNNILVLDSLMNYDVMDIFDKYGEVPLPKYIKRPHEDNDKDRYQTIYATHNGSVAAPTAGLHFTRNLLDRLLNKGIHIEYLTLHISYNTFRPIKNDNYLNHDIGSELFDIKSSVFSSIEKARSLNKRIISVGTTTTRVLEYCYSNGIESTFSGMTDLFIHPGYNFKAINCLITNFHLPKSTLLLLVSAFVGRENILNIYKYAIEKKYMFYSYGDSMLLENKL